MLNSLIQDYRGTESQPGLIRSDYQIETRQPQNLQDDSFVANIEALSRQHPSMSTSRSDEKRRPRTIHLMVVKENKNQPEAMEGLGYVNQTHLALDHVVKSTMTPVTPGVYPVLVTDTHEPIEAIHFDPDQSKAVPLAGPNYQAEELGPTRLPSGVDKMSRNRLRDLMQAILSKTDDAELDSEKIKTLKTHTFKELPPISSFDSVALLIQNFRALIYQILYENDLFNSRLQINDLPQADQELLKSSWKSDSNKIKK